MGERDFKLIETFGFHPNEGLRHKALHLARLRRSAEHFGIAYDPKAVEVVLAGLSAQADAAGGAALRCRLTLDRRGCLELEVSPLVRLSRPWVVQFAPQRLVSDDPWLQHKTTQRALYDAARASLPNGVDELLFLNERDELCEGTITSVFVKLRDGPLVTPSLQSGVLPGVLRQSKLRDGLVIEQVVTLAEFATAEYFYIGNALRGDIPAVLSSDSL